MQVRFDGLDLLAEAKGHAHPHEVLPLEPPDRRPVGCAAQELLGEGGALVERVGVAVDQCQRAAMPEAAELVRAGEPGRARAENDDVRRRHRDRRRRLIERLSDEDRAVLHPAGVAA